MKTSLPVFAGREVFGEHGDLGRRRDGPPVVVLVEEVVAVADGLAERSILKACRKENEQTI